MGTYVTVNDLTQIVGTDRMVALTDDHRTGAVDNAIAEQAIAQGEAEVNLALRTAGYTLPLAAPVDAMVVTLAVDCARYRLYRNVPVLEDVASAYDRAQRLLKQIAAGKMIIAVAANEEPVIHGAYNAREEIFTDDVLDRFTG